mgnify:CR=1 FL=1
MSPAAAPTRLLVATTNPGKLREIRAILGGLDLTLLTLADFAPIPEPEETGSTFVDNARIKALAYASATGELTVAEDSGLEIDALDGEPGVRSARFNGESYEEKFATIRRMLAERGVDGGTARFVCALVLARPDEIVWETNGVVEGRLQHPARGEGGFGYDPIFYYPPYGCTLAEVDGERKAAVSHRGAAFRAFRDYLIGPAAPTSSGDA